MYLSETPVCLRNAQAKMSSTTALGTLSAKRTALTAVGARARSAVRTLFLVCGGSAVSQSAT